MASEWPPVLLEDLVEVKHGFAFQGEFFSDEPPGDVLLTPGNFAIGGGFKGGKFKYYRGPVPEEFVLAPGDLLVTMTDLSKASDTLGYPALVPKSKIRFLHNQRVGKVQIKPNAGLDIHFLYYLLRTRKYRNEVLASATGTTVKHTSPTRIGKFRFRRPSLGEQQAIAFTLSVLDDKIDLNRKTDETLEAMARALFKSWFVDFDLVRAKAEGRDPGLPAPIAALFPDSFEASELGEIPKGWRVDSLLSDAKLLSGGTPKTDVDEYWNGDILWASAKDVSQSPYSFLVNTERKITSLGLEKSATQLIPAFSTVVVARGATTGRMVIFGKEMAMNQTCYAIASAINTPFTLYCRLRQQIDGLVHAAHGSVFDTITTSTFAQATIAAAPQAVSEQFESVAGPLFGRILANVLQSQLLTDVRDTLLPKLISGELGVADADRGVRGQI